MPGRTRPSRRVSISATKPSSSTYRRSAASSAPPTGLTRFAALSGAASSPFRTTHNTYNLKMTGMGGGRAAIRSARALPAWPFVLIAERLERCCGRRIDRETPCSRRWLGPTGGGRRTPPRNRFAKPSPAIQKNPRLRLGAGAAACLERRDARPRRRATTRSLDPNDARALSSGARSGDLIRAIPHARRSR